MKYAGFQRPIILFAIVLITLSLAACISPETQIATDPAPTVAASETVVPTAEATKAPEIIKIGFLGPFSGPNSQIGDQFKGGATIALEEISYKIGNYTIEPVWIDSLSDPIQAAQAYEQAVVEDGIQAGALNWHSSVALAVMEVTANYQIPHIFGFGTAERINQTFASDPEKYGTWSLKGWPTPSKLEISYVDALEYYIDQGVFTPVKKTAAIYGEDSDWGRSFAAEMIERFEAAGWEIVSAEYFPLEQTEYASYLNQIDLLDPAVLAGTSTSPPQIISLINQVDEIGLESLLIADGLGWVDFCEISGSAANRVLDQIAGWNSEAGFIFADEFEEKFNLVPRAYSAGLAYDGTKMLIEIMREVYDSQGTLESKLIQEFVEDQVWTGEWVLNDGIVMAEYKYTEASIPDPVVGPGFYTFPVLQYEYADGKCLGKSIFPVESAIAELVVP